MDVLTDNMGSYCNNIRNKLVWLCSTIRVNGALNLQNMNIRAEYFFKEFLNLLMDWKLKNANTGDPNATGIDLIYKAENTVVQVSSTFTHDKIQRSINGVKDMPGYTFYFVAITETTQKYQDFDVPEGWVFNKNTHIWTLPGF